MEEEADGPGEPDARIQGVADVAANARERLDTLNDNPVLGQLPVETTRISTLLDGVEETLVAITDELATRDRNALVSSAVKNRITDRLSGAQDQLGLVELRIRDVEAQLRQWMRIAAFVGFLVCLWGLWGQLTLAHRGWQKSRHQEDLDGASSVVENQSEVDESDEQSMHLSEDTQSTGEATLVKQLTVQSNETVTVKVSLAVSERPAVVNLDGD